MGGKNCVIVDADADLDDAVPALAYSAFGFAGQKCRAASRALVHERIADTLLERLHGAVEALLVDQAQRFGVDVPPVIERRDAGAGRSATCRSRATRARASTSPARRPSTATSSPPRSSTGCRAASRVAEEEIFGPLLAVAARARHRRGVRDRLRRSRSRSPAGCSAATPAMVERVSRRLPVGNLYVNRHITGAMVARQPFGGNRLSGTGTKAGGPDYLLQFVEPRVVTEDTMRHGLVV